MKTKNGFVFIETMIVVVVLVSVLLIIYSSYTGLITLERRKVRYDDPAFIYKTKAISDFLVQLTDEEGNLILKNKVKQAKNNDNYFIVLSPEDNEFFVDKNLSRQDFFSKMYDNFNIQSIILINKNQIGNLKEDTIPSDFYNYLKSIDTSKDANTQFYFTIMYAEKVNGTRCDPNDLIKSDIPNTNMENKCTFYYSSLKIAI